MNVEAESKILYALGSRSHLAKCLDNAVMIGRTNSLVIEHAPLGDLRSYFCSQYMQGY